MTKSLPKGWRYDRLKDVAAINRRSLGASTDPNIEVDYLEISNVNVLGIVDRSEIEHLRFADAPSRARRCVSEGATIISSVRPNLQAVAFIDAMDSGLICSTGFNVVEPIRHKLVPRYLYYYLLSDDAKQYFMATAKGVGYPAIDDKEFSTVDVPLPPLPEQKRIAAFLDAKCADIDKAMVKTRNRLFPEIPNGWKIKRLKDVATIFGRIGFRGYTTADIVSEGEGALSLSPSNLKDVYMEYSKRTYISWEKYWESPEIIVNDGDVVMVKTGSSYGKTCLVRDLPCEATLNPQLVVLKDIKCDNRFLTFLLQNRSMQFQVECIVSGGTIPTMSQQKMRDFRFPLPPYSEQCEIANYLDAKRKNLDELTDNLRRQIKVLADYRKSLIHECVMGERRVG